MSVSSYGHRYLPHDEFIRLYNDLEINHPHSNIDERWLEFLEKEKILFPVCRIFFPLPYLKIINDVAFNPSNPYYGKQKFYLPDKYEEIHDLKSSVQDYFGLSKNLFHALDKKKNLNKKYIRNPKESKFCKWKNYENIVGTFACGDRYESTAKHYYAYWQVYHLYEVTKACKLNYTINVFDENIFSDLWTPGKGIPTEKIISRTLPLNHKQIRGDYYSQKTNFIFLSFYIQTILKYENIMFFSKEYEKNKFGYLSEQSSQKYVKNKKRIAKLVIGRFNLTMNQCFDFLRFLCEKFAEYEKQKMDKMCQLLKRDISQLSFLIEDGFELKYEDINNKLGRVRGFWRNTLDTIFPPMFSKERENILHTLSSTLSDKQNFVQFENVTKDEVEQFLKYLDTKNLQLFYYSLGQINLIQLRDQSIYLHIFYLSLLLENIIKTIGRESKVEELVLNLSGYGELKKILNNFFSREKWKHSLFEKWGNSTTVTSSTSVRNKILNEIMNANHHKNKDYDKIIKMFLICGVARNLSAHEQSKVYQLDRETYLIIVNNVVSAIWFVWKYSLDKGYINK